MEYCLGELLLGSVEMIVGDMRVHDGPKTFYGVQVRAIDWQLDQVDTTLWAREPFFPEFVGFVGLSGVFLFNFRPWLPGGQSSAPNGN